MTTCAAQGIVAPDLRVRTRPPRQTADRRTSPGATLGYRSPLAQLTDVQLMERVKAGESPAFEVIYDRHSRLAFSLAYRIVGASLAEDATQMGFLSAWRGAHRFRPDRGSVRSWLLACVRYSAIDALRRERTMNRAVDRCVSEPVGASEPAPDTLVAEREQACLAREALAGLSDRQRRVIELAYFDGLTHQEIATTMRIPLGTVKGRMRLGLAKLSSSLSAQI
jgi:RNA polymerase sigma-70 factor, ECF subfamily